MQEFKKTSTYKYTTQKNAEDKILYSRFPRATMRKPGTFNPVGFAPHNELTRPGHSANIQKLNHVITDTFLTDDYIVDGKVYKQRIQWPRSQDVGTAPQLYQEHSFIREFTQLNQGECYELARWWAPQGRYGIISKCFYHILCPKTPPPRPTFDPYCPNWILDEFDLEVTFIARLFYGPRDFLSVPAQDTMIQYLPGYGFGPIPRWSDQRWWWNNTDNDDIRWIIPEGHYMRLYMRYDGPLSTVTDDFTIRGRLVGFTQSLDNNGWKRYNIEGGW